jgi:hypothetical protein
MNDLDKALEWAEQWEGTDTNGAKRILTLAAAVRELREENARLRAHLSGSPLDQALNEGDGAYRP